MPTTIPAAGEIMDSVAALLNDVNKQLYTYTNILPYLKIALKDFREEAQLNSLPVSNRVSTVITVPANTTTISHLTIPALPDDLVEVQSLWEGNVSTGPFGLLTPVASLPRTLDGISGAGYGIWTWANNGIQIPPPNRTIYLKLDYISTLFQNVTDQNSSLGVINADSYLHYRTAGHCALYIGENESRAQALYAQAEDAKNKILGISAKTKQAIVTRRRPFRFR